MAPCGGIRISADYHYEGACSNVITVTKTGVANFKKKVYFLTMLVNNCLDRSFVIFFNSKKVKRD